MQFVASNMWKLHDILASFLATICPFKHKLNYFMVTLRVGRPSKQLWNPMSNKAQPDLHSLASQRLTNSNINLCIL